MKINNKLMYIGVLSALFVAGCSTGDIQSRGRLDYLQASSVNPLELPPDLAASTNRTDDQTTALLSKYQQQQSKVGSAQNVLVTSDAVRLERAGNQRWISTSLPADLVWTRSVQLFQELGLPLEVTNPQAGLLESGWVENRADVPDSFLRRMLAKALDSAFSSPTRDKFKLRLERSNNRVLVYITHYGMKDHASGNDDQYHTWVERPRDSELEAEFISRLMAKLGATNVQEHAVNNATQVVDSSNGLAVNRSIEYVWPQVGSLLDDGSVFRVQSQNSATHEFVVLQKDPTKKQGTVLAFWKKREPVYYRYNVVVRSNGKNSSIIEVRSLDNHSPQELINRLRTNFY